MTGVTSKHDDATCPRAAASFHNRQIKYSEGKIGINQPKK